MESLTFEYRGGRALAAQPAPVLVGVVGSGNLEVLVEPAPLGGLCRIEILTAAVGFGATWQAVMDDVFARHPLADLRISINDVGATPAVVGLRLDQALEEFAGGAKP
ncbi:malonate decarboxylase subunit delta [Azospirillum thiophilum]|uniref:Malonate decarboxylase acyl carrier protein n=1 Tax=Azospirillum thiophilum TaxID=528244 RepID=A0AAC8ZVF2_9PROT|nr:malonate decarboxylase acyl carrier protein [Azospirillum thiophilum]ALG73765.1 malonate decarboxylase subunit delta [Azospirillum thiophilum]KJR63152.1 malonate decarboxylase subunit delta [Azospirillum thiophilum]